MRWSVLFGHHSDAEGFHDLKTRRVAELMSVRPVASVIKAFERRFRVAVKRTESHVGSYFECSFSDESWNCSDVVDRGCVGKRGYCELKEVLVEFGY